MLSLFQRLLQVSSFFLGVFYPISNYAAELNLELFPGLELHSNEIVRLKGLASLYPNAILFKEPKLKVRNQREEAVKIEILSNDIAYARVYRLDEAMTAIRKLIDTPALILDMRYLQSESPGIALVNLLNRTGDVASVTAVGTVTIEVENALKEAPGASGQRNNPIIVLCNRETAGPFEAILHSLQANNSIIAVGEPTAGRTGYYRKLNIEAWVVEGELRPSAEISILKSGFVPRIKINATPESNYLSYHLYEAGTPITRLLRHDAKQQATELEKSTDDSLKELEEFEPDAVLQRGVDIVAALQILEQLPENKHTDQL